MLHIVDSSHTKINRALNEARQLSTPNNYRVAPLSYNLDHSCPTEMNKGNIDIH